VALIQAFKLKNAPAPSPGGNQSGIALFMVISAITILSLLVTEFTYITQVNSRMAFDSLDQIKAHYLAKSGLKISLLRLKAYQQVQAFVGKKANGAGGAVPKAIVEKIWNFPFFYPFPTNIPGITMTQKDAIEKFQKESGLEGRFSASIESESSKFNLNSFLPSFASLELPEPAASPSPKVSPTPRPSFKPEVAQKSLTDYIGKILDDKFREDPDFASEYRDFRLEEFMDGVFAWGDHTYEQKSSGGRQVIPFKKAPFYSVTELHMIYPMDDALYELLSPNLTASTTTGININTMKEPTLRALVPDLSDEEVKEFFEFRDDPLEDHSFKSEDEFFKYLESKVGSFRGDAKEVARFKQTLTDRGIRLVTEENVFKITVQAQVNQASRLIEAWVTLDPASDSAKKGANDPTVSGQPPLGNFGPLGSASETPSSGLRITFMRLL
jgi:hypothetical protein